MHTRFTRKLVRINLTKQFSNLCTDIFHLCWVILKHYLFKYHFFPLLFSLKVKMLVAQLCLTLCDTHGVSMICQTPLPMESSRQGYRSG